MDIMNFPQTVDEFMEQYKIVDREEVYTNGAEMVPIFRMKQWFEHEVNHNAEPGKMVEDCISRQAVLDLPRNITRNMKGDVVEESIDVEMIKSLPPVQPQILSEKMDKAYDDGYEAGYLQAKHDWGNEDGTD